MVTVAENVVYTVLSVVGKVTVPQLVDTNALYDITGNCKSTNTEYWLSAQP